jgi:hypothetical protein
MNNLKPKPGNRATKRNCCRRERQSIAVVRGNAYRRKPIHIDFRLLVPRIPRREDENPVPEAAQVMGELLQGDRETIQQRGKIAGEKTNSQKRSGYRVPGSALQFRVPGSGFRVK